MTTLNTALTSRGLSVKDNLNASTDPGPGNDSSQGYVVGSLWQNSTTGRVWVARSVSVAAAVWTMLGFPDHQGYIASTWWLPSGISGRVNGAGTAPGANSIRLIPGFIKQRITINSLGARITTASAGGNVQFAIYANNAATGRPTGNALASTSSASTTSTGNVNGSVSVQVEPGMYWWASNCDNAVAVFAVVNVDSIYLPQLVGSATQSTALGAGQTYSGLSVSQTFGTWPSLTSASFTEQGGQNVPIVQFQVGSVP